MKIRTLKNILKRLKVFGILGTYIVFFLIVALIIMLAEPSVTNYGDALWYCYVNMFTIGFGDIVPVTIVGRIVSVLLTIYATFIIALLTGVVVAYYTEMTKRKYKATKEELLSQAQDLDKLTTKELRQLVKKIEKLD